MELEHLVNVLGNATPDPEFALEYAKQIHEFFRNPLDPSKLDQYLGLAFPEKEGLCTFLTERLTVKKYNSSKEQILLLIKLILSRNDRTWKQKVFPFCNRFKLLSHLYWRNKSEPSKHQQIALDNLIILMENYENNIDEQEFDLPNLYWELLPASDKTSFQPSVRGKIFHALGLVASLTCESFFKRQDYFDQLFNHIVANVKNQVESKDSHLEVAILLGCLKAMDRILKKCGNRVNRDCDGWKCFYTNLEQVVDPRCSIANDGTGQYQVKRREFQRAGLELVANNAHYFGKDLYRDYEQWYKDLITWAKSNNADDNSVGRKAMFKFLESVTEYTKIETEEMETDSHGKFVAYFLKTFQDILNTKNANRSELLVAVKGVGLLSTSCETPQQVECVFDKIVEHINNIVVELNSPVTDKYSGSLSMVSAYLESVGNILPHVIVVEDNKSNRKFLSHINSVEQLTVQLMTFYPDFSERVRAFAHISVYKITNGLRLKHTECCIPFIDRVVNQALSHVIASPTKAELDILIESWNKNTQRPDTRKSATSQLGLRGVKAYIPFWINLTNRECEATVQLLYDRIIQWTFSTIEKLDLTMTLEADDQKESGCGGGDILESVKANVLKDFHLFVNLVEFLQELIPKTNPRLFEKWVEVFITDVIALIEQHPLVSGFYKILAMTMEMSRKLNYFRSENLERQSLFQTCNTFMKSLTNKIGEFRDDLLVSVLELWLSAPDELMIQNFSSLNLTLKVIFEMGRSCFSLAERCIEAIERWIIMEDFPREEIEKLMQNLFPIWQKYFISAGFESLLIRDKTQTKSKLSSNKAKLEREEKKLKQLSAELDEVSLRNVQLKLLHLIGSFGHILDLEDDGEKCDALEMEMKVLKYSVPFQDIKPDVYLDSLLPRVYELCNHSAERQVRTSACEMLHTLVIYFLGHMETLNSDTIGSSMDLFSQLFRTVMKLSCDSDVLIRQLFNPLMFQCIHLFTKERTGYSETIRRLIVDGLNQSEDSQLRDFAGGCLSEYFNWSLKHDKQHLAECVLEDLSAMSTHAATQYRLGAAVGFNGIYREFREDGKLSNAYSIKMLVSFITSLAISSDFVCDSVIIKTTKMSISHLERILIRKKRDFNTNIGGRKRPAGFPFKSLCLRDVSEFLLMQVGRKEMICREESSRLLTVLGPLVHECGSLQNFLQSVISSYPSEKFIEFAEQSAALCDLNSLNGLLDFLDAASEFYSLLDTCNILNPSYFSNSNSVFEKSFKKVLKVEVEEINGSSCKPLLRILGQFHHFQNSFESPMQDDFLTLSIPISKMFFDHKAAVTLSNIWSNCNISCSMKIELENIIDMNIEKQLEEKSNSEVLKYVHWLIAAAESKFLHQIFGEDKIQVFAKTIWNLMERNLYVQNKTNEFETITVSKSRADVLEKLLKLCMVAGMNDIRIVDAAFDQTIVQVKSSLSKNSSKGEIFQQVLLPALLQCEEMLAFPKLINRIKIEKIGAVIEGFLSLMKRNKPLRQQMGQKIVNNVIAVWTAISVNCDHYTVARILSGLAAVDIQLCRDSEELANWWCGRQMMGASHLSLKEKSEFIGFLGLFAMSRKTVIVNDVIDAVEMLALKDLKPDAKWIEDEGYITKVILQVLSLYEKIPRQWKILEVLVLLVSKSATIAGANVTASVFKEVKKRLVKVVKSFVANRQVIEQSEMVQRIRQAISTKYEDCLRNLSVCKLCLIPVLASVTPKAAISFFKENVFSVIEQANSTPTTSEQWNLKTVAFNVLEMLAHKGGGEFIRGNELQELYLAKLKTDGVTDLEKQNVLRSVTLACMNFKRRGMPSDINESMRQIVLQCNAASYNALAANLIATDAKPTILEGMLFSEDRTKNFLWENVIDSVLEYNFPVVFDETFIKREKYSFSSKNKEIEEPSKHNEEGFNPLVDNRSNLVESSLAAEATNYDFTAAVTVANSAYYQRIFASTSKPTESTTLISNIPDVTIEWNEINKHECMLAFVAAMKKLASIPPTSEQCPAWVAYLQKVLKGTHHVNIKIFILGAFLNCQETMEPHAKHFMEPILSLILNPNESRFGHEKLNYFIKDVIVMLLSWHNSAVPTDRSKTALLHYIISNIEFQDSTTFRHDVYDQNLRLIRTIVEYWNCTTEIIPSDLIMDRLQNPAPKIGLGVCKSILSAGRLPVSEVTKLMNQFCRALKNSSKPIYCDAAENIGLLLKNLRDIEYSDISKAVEYMQGKLNGEKSRPLAFVTMLLHFKTHSSAEIMLFKPSLFEFLNTSSVSSEVMQLLRTCLSEEMKAATDKKEAASSFLSDLEGRRIFQRTCTGVSEAAVVIEMLEVFLNYLDDSKRLVKILNWVKVLEENENSDGNLRAQYARCVLKLYNITKIGDTPAFSSTEKALLKVFVRLFKDEDPQVQEVVHQFWSNCLQKWNESPNLILELMELVGDRENSIEIILGLIFKRCSASPDFQKDVFSKGFEGCPFFKYNLDTSWRMRHASFQPLFAESLSSSQTFSTLPKPIQSTILSQRQNVGKFGVNLLRATLSVKDFTLTQQQQDSGESMEIDDDFQFLSQNQNYSDSEEASEVQTPSQSDPLASLRRRFYRRPDSGFFARKEVERQATRFEAAVETVKMKRSNVKLARSYRVGELPDITFKHSELLKTMSTLTKSDDEIGRSIVVLIFTGMKSELEQRDRKAIKNFLKKTREVFETLLKNYGRMLNPCFAAAIVEIIVRNKISVSSSFISSVCPYLDLHELGILALENTLNESNMESRPSSSKRARLDTINAESEEVSVWMSIAEFYKDLEEFDVLRNIFSIMSGKTEVSVNVYGGVRKALSLEAQGNLEDAFEMYAKLYGDWNNEHHDFGFGKFLEDALTNCLTRLSSWDQLYEEAEKYKNALGSDEVLFENQDFLGRILPLRVQSGMQLFFEAVEDQESKANTLATDFKSFMLQNGEDEAKFLQSRYPMEVAVLLTTGDLQCTAKSSSLLEKGWNIGLKDFQLFPKLSQPQRRERTLMLQQASVLQDILQWVRGIDSSNIEMRTIQLCCKMDKLSNYKMASLLNSDMIVAERAHFLSNIMGHRMLTTNEGLLTKLEKVNFHQHLWILELGIRDGNLMVANKYLEKSKKLGDAISEEEFLEWRKMYIHYLAAFHKHTPLEEWLKMWSSAWKKVASGGKLQLQGSDAFQMQGKLLRSLIEVTMDKGDIVKSKTSARVHNVILNTNSSQNQSSGSTNLSIVDSAVEGSKQLIDRLGGHSLGNDSKAHKAYMEMFNLLKSLMKNFPEKYEEDQNLMELMIKCLLQSIDGKEGLLLFPNILPFLEKHSSLHAIFNEHVINVPTWTFLPWLDQIITLYRTNNSLKSVLSPIITRLRDTYPQAFQLQYVDLLPRSSASSIQEKYAKALKALVLPMQLHENMLRQIESCKVRKNVDNMIKKLIEFKESLQDICDTPEFYGEFHMMYSNQMIDIINTQLEKLNTHKKQANESQNSTSSHSQIAVKSEIFNELLTTDSRLSSCNKEQTVKILGKQEGKAVLELRKLSPWLADFHHSSCKDEIEVPGLYDGLNKPDILFHPKVVSFCPTVNVHRSITKPLSFVLLGNNGKQVQFLAKYGDDLRQDRRIQQLFRISNSIFSEDDKTHRRKLDVETYAVVPLTDIFGIIHFVKKTKALKDFIFNSPTLMEAFKNSSQKHRKWIESTSGVTLKTHQDHNVYCSSIKKVERREVEKHFDSMTSFVPRNLLSDHIQERSRSLEQFFKVRQHMIQSYAAMSVVHWLLGIGDRHLENCLFSSETGKVVGIDFGRAFGTGNTSLRIPEIVPFRLTHQLQQLMTPYGCKGLFKETMLHAWRSLLNSSDMILSIINIFVNERSIDWSKRRANSKNFVSEGPREDWMPMKIMEKKLKCHNPVKILLEEINCNQLAAIIPVYREFIESGRESMLKKDTLSEEEVIDVLLDVAMDKTILSRIFLGWAPWV